jgi:hypothetical protein
MKKELLIKTFVISIVFLFIGVSFQPVFAVDNKSSTDNIKNENDCDCETVSDVQLIRIDKLLNTLEFYTKKLSFLFKDNTRFIEKCKELSKSISRIRVMNNEPELLCLFMIVYFFTVVEFRFDLAYTLFEGGTGSPILDIFIKVWFSSFYYRFILGLNLFEQLCPSFVPWDFLSSNLNSMYKEGIKK